MIPKAVFRQETICAPVPVLVARHVKAPPAAYGPSATVQSGISTSSSGAESVARFVQAEGSALGHCAFSAVVRQVTMFEPAVLTEMPVVTRHCAALPTPKAPRAVTQRGIWTRSWRPVMLPMLEHALGSDTEQVGVVGGRQTAAPPPPGVVVCKPRAVCRQATMPVPAVPVVIWDVDRQVRAVPTANGPRAVTQSAMSGMSARPVSVLSLVHAAGSDVMH